MLVRAQLFKACAYHVCATKNVKVGRSRARCTAPDASLRRSRFSPRETKACTRAFLFFFKNNDWTTAISSQRDVRFMRYSKISYIFEISARIILLFSSFLLFALRMYLINNYKRSELRRRQRRLR